MPTYIDIHDLPGDVTAEDLAKAHLADVQVQGKHGVEYHKYWLNRKNGKVFCMCTAPSAEAAAAVHREAHGMTALKIMEVTPDMADAFMGASEVDEGGAVLLPRSREHDTGTRTVLFTDIVGSTSLTQRLGDDAAMTVVGIHDFDRPRSVGWGEWARSETYWGRHHGGLLFGRLGRSLRYQGAAGSLAAPRWASRFAASNSHRHRRRRTDRASQRSLRFDRPTGGAALRPRRSR